MKINGQQHYLWRAVDHEGDILESYVTKTRAKRKRRSVRGALTEPSAALALIKRALKNYGKPEKVVTGGLRSYSAAMTELGNQHKQEIGRHKNNRAENSHLPFRRRERAMLRFRQMKTLQKFGSGRAQINNHLNTQGHLIDRPTYKLLRSATFAEWSQIVS